MEFRRACYSVSKLKEAAEIVKGINLTVKRKNEHFAKYMELYKAYQYAADNLNRWLFDPDNDLKEYRNAAYNYWAYTSKDLDKMFRCCYRYICNELDGIAAAIRSGEVDQCE